MLTDAVNTTGNRAFVYEAFATRISSDGTPPTTEGTVSQSMIPVEVSQSAGGQELDYAQIVSKGTDPLINRTQPANFSRMVDVLLPDENMTRVHLGDYVNESEIVQPGGEQLTAQSHLRPYHFGTPLQGELWQFGVFGGDIQTVKKDITFNPNINGEVLPNMSSEERDDGLSQLWVHPQTTEVSGEEYGENVARSKWDLNEAIKALCWACNEDEEFILNPTSWDTITDPPALENVILPRGQYLPFYLDRLLHPLGYNWYVDYGDRKGWKKDQPEIKIFQKGAGTEKEIYYQAPDRPLKLDKTNCDQYGISRNIADNYNAVRVLGAKDQMEGTFVLYKSWSEDDDSLTADDLKRKGGASYPTKPTVRRLFTAGEGGGLVGLRSDVLVAVPEFDGTGGFSLAAQYRRKVMPPLTYQGKAGKKTRRDVILETVAEGTGDREEYAGSFGILPDQIGVLITDDELPSEIMNADYLLLTCTIEGDSRIEGVAEREAHAVNGRDVWLELDLSDKFGRRWVVATGNEHASKLDGDAAGADTVDDSTAIQEYAEALLAQGGYAELDCEFTLPGIHLHYEIGDLITNIAGREVSLDAASATAPAAVYPQVTKRTFRYHPDTGPETILTLDRGVPQVQPPEVIEVVDFITNNTQNIA